MAKRYNSLYGENLAPLAGMPLVIRALRGGSKEAIATAATDTYVSVRPTGYETGDLFMSIENMDTTAANYVMFFPWTASSGGGSPGVTHQRLSAGAKVYFILKDGETHIAMRPGAGSPNVRFEILNADIT